MSDKRGFINGGEVEIRTPEDISALRDFQSRALDQLGDFSVSAAHCNRYIIPQSQAVVKDF